MIKEIKIFISLFFILALSMHFSAWVNHPLEHIESLSNSSLGIYHPLFITLGIYMVLAFLRGLYSFIKKVFKK